MKKDLTEVVFILDRSGSMSSLVQDTIGGFNSFVEQQKQEVGEARMTTVLFDDKYEVLHNGINMLDVPILTEKEYNARGMTALLDAIGKTINDVGDRLSKTDETERPEKVIFAITTDGQENSSREFARQQIKDMIERQQNIYNWKFLFLGANIDAIGEANSLGISNDFVAQYSATNIGAQSVYTSLSKGVSSLRTSSTNCVSTDWASDIK